MKLPQVCLLVICTCSFKVQASATSEDWNMCHAIAAKTLEYCLNGRGSKCWDKSRDAMEACYRDVHNTYARTPENELRRAHAYKASLMNEFRHAACAKRSKTEECRVIKRKIIQADERIRRIKQRMADKATRREQPGR